MQFRIDRVQRDALHTEAIINLGEINRPLEDDDYALAEQLRPRHEAVMRLLDDIGWGPDDPGRRFVLTMPAEQLAVAVQHLGDLARERLLAHHRDAPTTEDGRVSEQYPFFEDVEHCATVLHAGGSLLRRTGTSPERPEPITATSTSAFASVAGSERDLLRTATFDSILTTQNTIPVAILAGDIRLAKQQRVHYEAAWRLLDDLGWASEDPRDQFDLTAPAEQLAQALARVQAEADYRTLQRIDQVLSSDDADAVAALQFDRRRRKLCQALLYELPAGTGRAARETLDEEA